MTDSAAIFVPRRTARVNLAAAAYVALTVLTVLAIMLVSNLTLTALGIPYEIEGGSPLTKIHPATYLASMAMAAFLFVPGNPFIALDDIVRRHRGLLLFLISWFYMLIHISIVLRGPFTNIVDTFLLPPFLIILLARLKENLLHRLALILHVIFVVNALLGTFELVTGWRMTPLVVNGLSLSSDFRPSAIFGHPLANAAAVGCYMIALLLGGNRDLPPALRAPAFLLQAFALIVFGGRAASVLVIPFAGAILAYQAIKAVREKRITTYAAAAFTLGVPLIIIAVLTAYQAGAFDRFIERFLDDDGSAKTRYEMFVLLAQLPLHDLIFGPDPELIASLKFQFGLEYGIESFWVSLVANYGLMSTGFFLIGLFCLCVSIARAASPQSGWVVFYFILVASTSESISAKTTAFAIAVVTVMILQRQQAPSLRRHR